ncbi:MAG: glycosyltransferase [Planctomycetes bacterium]|jgi:glycosyltransferase involved in cell wall biosynthesis|nr:glycosyltransferase [Planctomycetota bacterium]
MRIVFLTPGTGNFHCGSCLHDEALARALRRLGHEAHIVGLYLPLMMDQRDAEQGPAVQMGGVNLYLQQKLPWLRYVPLLRRLLDAPALLKLAADRADLTSPQQLGRMTVEMLRGMDGRTAHELRRMIDHLQHAAHRPGVVMLNNALLLSLAAPIKDALGCKVACTLQGEDTFLDGLPEPWRSDAWAQLRDAAGACDLFLPVSEYYAGVMRPRLALDPDKVRVVHNGIEVADFDTFAQQNSRAQTTPEPAHDPAQGATGGSPARAASQEPATHWRTSRQWHTNHRDEPGESPRTIGYLARLNETKGVFTLLDAFVALTQEQDLADMRLALVGAATPHDRRRLDAALAKLPGKVRQAVSVHAKVDRPRKIELLHQIDVLSVPTTYGESFGLYVLEANAAGVPVVQPDHAAFGEVIGATGGGMLYDAEDPAGLTRALAELLRDDARRRALGEAGRAAVRERFTADVMARHTLAALETLCPPADSN